MPPHEGAAAATAVSTYDLPLPQHRLMATTVDCVLLMATLFLLHLPLFIVRSFFPGIINQLLHLLIVIVCAAAVLLKDGPWDLGTMLDMRSPGKRAVNLRVVNAQTRQPIDFVTSIQRNLPFAVPAVGTVLAELIAIVPLGPLEIVKVAVLPLVALLTLVVSLGAIGFETWQIFKAPDQRHWGDLRAGTVVIRD